MTAVAVPARESLDPNECAIHVDCREPNGQAWLTVYWREPNRDGICCRRLHTSVVGFVRNTHACGGTVSALDKATARVLHEIRAEVTW